MHGVHAKTIALGGMSKTYGCPGLRIGWLATHATVLHSIGVAKDYTSICSCAPGTLHPDKRPFSSLDESNA